MKKPSPQKGFTVDEWYDRQYPLRALAYFHVLKNGKLVDRDSETIDFSGEADGMRHLQPKKFFDDRSKQREYLIKEIKKLYARSKTRGLYRISFDDTTLSEGDLREKWPDWNAQ